MQPITIGWWSAGITSALACKLALETNQHVKLFYIETGAAHSDNARFKADCEQWYGLPIITVKNRQGFENPLDVVLKTGMVNSPYGAECTNALKKEVRFDIEELYSLNLFNDIVATQQIFGYEFETKEVNRAIRFLQQYPKAGALFPLIEKQINKSNCAAIIKGAGIKLPAMYDMGYSNNNCIGCLKGGKGYWNKIRQDFPQVFEQTAKVERQVGHTCINGTYLDELKPGSGRMKKAIVPDCGNFCDLEFTDKPARRLKEVLDGKISIYQAA